MANSGFRDRMGDTAMILTGLAIGAGAMYIFDPEEGSRRRAQAGQKAIRGGHVAGRWIGRKTIDLANRAWGVGAELSSKFRDRTRDIPDQQLEARARAQLGHVLSHPGAIEIRAQNGVVTVSGDVLEGERAKIEERLRKTRGVHNCNLEVREHAGPGDISSLQGPSRSQRKTGT